MEWTWLSRVLMCLRRLRLRFRLRWCCWGCCVWFVLLCVISCSYLRTLLLLLLLAVRNENGGIIPYRHPRPRSMTPCMYKLASSCVFVEVLFLFWLLFALLLALGWVLLCLLWDVKRCIIVRFTCNNLFFTCSSNVGWPAGCQGPHLNACWMQSRKKIKIHIITVKAESTIVIHSREVN